MKETFWIRLEHGMTYIHCDGDKHKAWIEGGKAADVSIERLQVALKTLAAIGIKTGKI